MEQKNLKNNFILIILSFVTEIIFINVIFPVNIGIAFYIDIYKYLEVLVVILGLDIVYALFCIDSFKNPKNFKNVLDQYKNAILYKTEKYFIILEIIKTLIIFCIIGEEDFLLDIILVFALTLIIYLILVNIFIKDENVVRKVLKLKIDSVFGKTKLNFILINGTRTPNSLDLQNKIEQEVNKNNFYINLKDLEKIKSKKIKNSIINNTIAIVHELKMVTDKNIITAIESLTFDTVKIYHIIAGKNAKKSKLSEILQIRNDIELCDIDSVIEFVENFFEKAKIKTTKTTFLFNYILSAKNSISEKQEEKVLNSLENIYIDNFNKRLKRIDTKNLPKNKFLLQMYKNAFLNQSPYQSVLLYFNYLTVMAKCVQYYSYAINPNSNFATNRINNTIVKDNPSCYLTQILVNVFENKNHPLYKHIREEKIILSKEERVLVTYYLSKLLNINISGKEITFEGLTELFLAFRNKIEAHGIINDTNVYAVWNLTYFFVNCLNKLFKIDSLEIKYLDNGAIKVGYNKKLALLGEYIICRDDSIFIIKERKASKNTYINYLTGENFCS